MTSQDLAKFNLPSEPGVYLFKKNKQILYIGKATSLKSRVRSYFAHDLIWKRSPIISQMVEKANTIEFIKTDSVLEALILEANLIKKHQPFHNTQEKDDKSYNYVVITKEDFPRVLIERGRNISFTDKKIDGQKLKYIFGPFTQGMSLRDAMKIIRKIIPFRDTCAIGQDKPCFNHQLGLCPGTCVGAMSKAEYMKTIRNIKLFFEGKKKSLIKTLEKEMHAQASEQKFEHAGEIKRQIFALKHINDIALIKDEVQYTDKLVYDSTFRIEAYDVAHISGTNTVGVMTIIENGRVNKNEYRKFNIKLSSQNDVAGLEEILRRRLKHIEWNYPNIAVVDGGIAQKNIAEKVFREMKVDAIIVAVTKDERHRPKMIQGREDMVEKYKKEILLANSEAHRFAIQFHRAKRNRNQLM